VVAGYGRGGKEEAAPVEGGERRRRRPRDFRSCAKEVVGSAWRCAVWPAERRR
jgi:hypothetical protein